MEAAHARAATTLVSPSSGASPRVGAIPVPIRPQVSSTDIKLRVLIAERRASAHSELSRRLDHAGHEVLARVTSGQGALDYAELLRPDAVLIAPALEDGPGIMAAIALTRELPGVAAVVLTTHPAAVNPAARPNWGAVALVPADAEPSDLDIELRRAVIQAREAVATAVVPEQMAGSQPRPADFAPIAPATPQYQTPVPEPVSAVVRETQSRPAPAVKQSSGSTAVPGGRSPLSFTDEDLIAIGPVVAPDAPGMRGAAVQSIPMAASAPLGAPVGSAPASPVVPTPPLTLTSSSAVPSPAPMTSMPAGAPALYDAETALVTEAAECLLERTGLSRSDAMRLMEQEAADTGRKLVEIAQSVLGRDGEAAGPELALAS